MQVDSMLETNELYTWLDSTLRSERDDIEMRHKDMLASFLRRINGPAQIDFDKQPMYRGHHECDIRQNEMQHQEVNEQIISNELVAYTPYLSDVERSSPQPSGKLVSPGQAAAGRLARESPVERADITKDISTDISNISEPLSARIIAISASWVDAFSPAQVVEGHAGESAQGANQHTLVNQHAGETPTFHSFLNFRAQMEDCTPVEETRYDVTRFYHKEGFAQAVVLSSRFVDLTSFVIFVNSIYLGYEVNNNVADSIQDSQWYYQVAEHLFCVFFSVELVVRFLAFRDKRRAIGDSWFRFDSFLVALMVTETWLLPLILFVSSVNTQTLPTGPFKILRLLRISRLSRLMRLLPELMTMITGMYVAVRAVSSAMLLLVITTYVFGIALFLGLGGEEELHEKFGTLPACMSTLIYDGLFMDKVRVLDDIISISWYMALPYTMFVMIAWMTVMNMLIGILCEVVCAVSQSQEEQLQVDALKQTVLSVLLTADTDGDGMFNVDELEACLHDEKSAGVLCGLHVDIDHVLGWVSYIYKLDPQLVSVRFVMNTILSARRDRSATVADLIDAHTYDRWCQEKRFEELQKEISSGFALMQRVYSPAVVAAAAGDILL